MESYTNVPRLRSASKLTRNKCLTSKTIILLVIYYFEYIFRTFLYD